MGIGLDRLAPGAKPFGVPFAPDLLMQTGQGHRVAEQGYALVVVQPSRADFQRMPHAIGTQPFNRLRLTMARGCQGAGQGVLLRVDHCPYKTVVECL